MIPPQAPDAEPGNHLAATLQRLATGGDRALLGRTVRRLCLQRSAGHVCIELGDWQGQPGDDGVGFPPRAAFRSALLDTGLVQTHDHDPTAPPRPLVLDAADRLYLHRDHAAEQRILAFVRERLAAPPEQPPSTIRHALDELTLLPAPGHAVDWQLAAVVMALRSRFSLLTGGPGTGKTTTVARLLAVLLHLAPGLRIALAAPTGKAAARLAEALRERAATTPGLRTAVDRLQPVTLHRLLGYLPLEDRFRVGRAAPLALDLVVVDEASMVDPAVLAVLCEALPPTARLLLVGDRDQLAAIAAGQVLGDLCRAAAPQRGVAAPLAEYVAAATGMHLPVQADAPPLAAAVIALRENHRFGRQPGIGAFAAALAARDVPAALQALAAGHPDLRHPADPAAALADLEPALLAAMRADTPAAALAALPTCRVLCALRHGPTGTLAWNQRIEARLQTFGVRCDGPWYRGRPVLVVENDHQQQIWNGDLGVCWPLPDGRPGVLFPAANGSHRHVPAQRLPAHETAWAMTVHKAQGSEFDTVLVVMPDQPGPSWQAALLYTGITRARRQALLLADPGLLPQGLAHWPQRGSGLAAALAADATAGSGSPSSQAP